MNSKQLLSRWQLTSHDRRKLTDALTVAQTGRQARRLGAVLLVAEGYPVRQVTGMTGLSHQSIYTALSRYGSRRDPQALRDHPRSGRPRTAARVTPGRLRVVLRKKPWALGYNAATWTADLLARELRRRYGVSLSSHTVRRRLRGLRWRWKRPRYIYKQPDPHAAQKKGASSGV
jgi:transposase